MADGGVMRTPCGAPLDGPFGGLTQQAGKGFFAPCEI